MAHTEQGGTLILVTGPSGVGKDTLLDSMRGVAAADGRLVFARRIITRPAGAGGEMHIAVSTEEFLRRKAAGEFWTDWHVHGLHYALPRELLHNLQQGLCVLANVSRTITGTLASLWPRTVVIEVSAPQHLINQRLNQRARENSEGIQQRLQRTVAPGPDSLDTITVLNDASPQQGIERFRQAVMTILERHPLPDSGTQVDNKPGPGGKSR